MADMGADVIKVEPPVFGDLGRVLQMHGEHRVSAYHLAHSRGKRSVTVNLKTDAGREIVRKLIPQCDVIVHNFRPGVMERLGLGYDDVRPLNERIIYAHASGWGTKGPKAKHPAFDIAAQARSGLMSMTGEADGGPLPVGVAVADYMRRHEPGDGRDRGAVRARDDRRRPEGRDVALRDGDRVAGVGAADVHHGPRRSAAPAAATPTCRRSGARSRRRTAGRWSAASATTAGRRSAPPSACRSWSTTSASTTAWRAIKNLEALYDAARRQVPRQDDGGVDRRCSKRTT